MHGDSRPELFRRYFRIKNDLIRCILAEFFCTAILVVSVFSLHYPQKLEKNFQKFFQFFQKCLFLSKNNILEEFFFKFKKESIIPDTRYLFLIMVFSSAVLPL